MQRVELRRVPEAYLLAAILTGWDFRHAEVAVGRDPSGRGIAGGRVWRAASLIFRRLCFRGNNFLRTVFFSLNSSFCLDVHLPE